MSGNVLYLVRHAKAEAGGEDDARRLTVSGRETAARIAKALAQRQVSVARIEHSPLVRARETARIIASEIGGGLADMNDLRPEADVESVRVRLATQPYNNVMLVGHNPFMEMLAGLLICEDAGSQVIVFHAGSAARLVSDAGALPRYACEWLIAP